MVTRYYINATQAPMSAPISGLRRRHIPRDHNHLAYQSMSANMRPNRDAGDVRSSHSLNDAVAAIAHHEDLDFGHLTQSNSNPLLTGMKLTHAVEGAVASLIADPGSSSVDRIQAWEAIQALAQDKLTTIAGLQGLRKGSHRVGDNRCLLLWLKVMLTILSGFDTVPPSSSDRPTLKRYDLRSEPARVSRSGISSACISG